MAKLIKTSGDVFDALPANRKAFTLDEMYELIGCTSIEVVRTRDPRIWLIVDEEYLLRPPPHVVNRIATNIYHDAGGRPDHPVCGDVLVCTPREAGE
jgi:hypothetical protein